MAISIGMAAASTATTALTGGTFIGGFLVASGTGTLLTHFLVSTALGAALNALSPKRSLSVGESGYNVTQTGTALDHQVIYGRVKIAGVRAFDGTTGTQNKYLHRVLMFAGHEIDAFETFYVNDEALTLDGSGEVTAPAKYVGKIRIKEHLGTSDQVADSDLVSEVADWTADHRLRGIAYIYARLSFDGDAFPNGVPEITALIRGKKVYDPRTSTTAWSDNSALCIRDYIASTNYGLGEASTNIDDTQVTTAANVCDLTDTPDSSTRYTCNGAFTTAATPYDTFNKLLTSMGGMAWYAQGKWRMRAATWNATVLDMDEDDLRSNITIQTRHSRRDNFNIVRGKFRGSESNWQITDYPEVKNAAFLTADGGQEAAADVDLPFTDTAAEARRIANIVLERNRQQLTVRAAFGMRAFQVQVGDNIRLTNTRFGWANKEFEVVEWTFGLVGKYDLQVNMTLRETAESAFDDISDGVVYEQDNTALLSPFDVPSVGLTITAESTVIREKLLNSISIEVTALESERVDYVEVEYKASADTDYIKAGVGEIGKFKVLDVSPGDYDIRARAINTFGVKGDWAYALDREIDSLAAAPEDVTGLARELSGGTVFLTWNAVSDLDLSYYEIRHNALTSGATWGTSTVAVSRVGRPSTSVTLPARSGTFLIKAWDKSGNPSDTAGTVVVLPADLPSLGTTDEQVEDPTFSGTKTNVAVDTSPTPDELIISDRSAASPSGTYEFSNYIDTGSARTARVTGIVTFNRHFDNAGDWDSIPGDWDTWPGNWDTWTDEQTAFGDISVSVEVAATDDDPAGSPTWGAWQAANGGEISGRAFKFRALLDATTTGASPSIETLKATVEY
jgi:hypothetical protein